MCTHCLTPDNSPNKKQFIRKMSKKIEFLQKRCQRKFLNEAQGQWNRVEENDKGPIQKLNPENWGKNQSNTTDRNEVTQVLKIIRRSWSLKQGKKGKAG